MSQISIIQVDPLTWDSQFTVDNTVIEVIIANVVGDITGYAGKGGGLVSKFIAGENIIIRSIGIRTPHLFAMGTIEPTLQIKAITGFAVTSLYPDLEIPYFNAEIPVDIYLNLEGPQASPGGPLDMEIGLEIIGGTVSMLNVPDIMQDEIVPVLPFLKVEHNFPLIA